MKVFMPGKAMHLLQHAKLLVNGALFANSQSRCFKRKLRLMKLMTSLLLLTALHVSAGGFSQKVTLSGKNLPLDQFFEQIRTQTGFEFVYEKNFLEKIQPFTLNLKDVPLKDALDKCLLNAGLTYQVRNNIIVITRANATPPTDAWLQAALNEPPPDIHGKVLDEKGQPLQGATISVSDSRQTVVSDEKGEFTLRLAGGKTHVLTVNYVGYQKQEITVNNNSEKIIATLKPESRSLDDMVIVGYAAQKKTDLTGSVSTISAQQLESRPTSNVSSSLAGLAAGMYVRQTSGLPGSDGASISIRGLGTLSSTSVLVLVDGIIGSIDAVNPADVESVTVLKDASSASIYGALAANGVVLITTRKGSKNNRPSVTYNGLFSQTHPSGVPDFVNNSARNMQLINEAATNIGNAVVFDSASVIQPFIDASKNPNGVTSLGVPNYVAYPNTNWENVLFRNNWLQNHNIAVNGGNDKTTYQLSLGYLKNPGLIPNSGIEKYQFRANVEAKIGDNITVGTQTFGYLQNSGLVDASNLFNYLVQTSPTIYPYYNGKYGSTSAAGSVVGQASNLLYYTQNYSGALNNTTINTTWYARAKIIKGLVFEPKVNYQAGFNEQNYSDNPVATERWNFLTMQQVTAPTPSNNLHTYNYFGKTWNYTLESVLRYNTTIARDHNIGALAGFNQYYYYSYNTAITGYGLIDPSVPAISTATSFPTNPSGSATNWGMRSFFGRVNYNYKEKYLFEANIRDDGSSRFGPANRYGVFPSVSGGWNLTKESFMHHLADYNIQNLKLRGSWGQLGNTASGNYQWQATYGAVAYSFNGVAATGLRQGQIANPALQWETTNITDIGLDAVAFKRLNISIDWYNRFTKGILFTAPLDLTVGTAAAPVGNFAQVLNKGIETTIGWSGKAGQLQYNINGNFSYNYLNKVERYKGPLVEGWSTDASGNKVYTSNIGAVSAGSSTRILEGHTISEYYLQTMYQGTGRYTKADGTLDPNGGPKDGMIRTPQDLAWAQSMIAAGKKFAPVNTIGKGQLYYGDLIYADNNGDGTYGGSNDQKFMKISSTPKYVFGLNLNASWKGIDVSMIWAGAAGMKYYWNQTYYNSIILTTGGEVPTRIADNHYYYNVANPADPRNNVNGFFPRLKYTDNIDNVASTFWFYNASYIRLKNLQIGYTLPQRLMGKVKAYITRARFFISGENLITITQFPGPDPEIGTSVAYPTMKQYAFGTTLTF